VLKTFVLAVFSVSVVLTIAHLVFRPPSLAGRTISKAVVASSDTSLGKLALNAKAGVSSGVVPLLDGPGAFAARIALIRKAEAALDVQYYIWQRDATGLILLNELRQAAERGVRVRLLLNAFAASGSVVINSFQAQCPTRGLSEAKARLV